MPHEAHTQETGLEKLQRWMQEVVVHPGTVEEAIASPAAEREIPSNRLADVVLPSASLTSAERVGVYHGMYLMRMEEALATDYPVIHYLLGDDGFGRPRAGVRPTLPLAELHPEPARRAACRSSSPKGPTGRRSGCSTTWPGSSWP